MEPIQFTKNETAAQVIAKNYGRTPRVYLHSFGCQQNVNDGEKIRGVLMDVGYECCDKASEADLVVFNTCAVREHAEQRV
ncbi:MAG: tRNA (N6-isopentenyl adenosine(37)-C2)-methylthiotransferase MiaB, partial [Ruthenibacterium sp.]